MNDVDKAAAFSALALAGASVLRERGVEPSWSGLKQGLRAAVAADPLDALAVTVLGGTFLFWLAERDANPELQGFFDALVFVSTSVSIGFPSASAKTKAGRSIAAALRAVGPSIAAAALAAPGAGRPAVGPEVAAVTAAITGKLDEILVELRAGRTAS